MSISSLRAAYKICNLSDWTISNIKLQKILYLSNMVYLYRYKKPLITDQFEAWKYGPVLPILYNKVKRFGTDPISKYIFDPDLEQINNKLIDEFLIEAWEKLGFKANWELVSMTHRKNGAWKKVYEENKKNTITLDDIRNEYLGLYKKASTKKSDS